MGVMTEIRQRAGGAMIGVLVVAFGGLWALQDSGAFDNVGMGPNPRVIGTVDGADIDGETYSRALEQRLQAYQQQGVPVSAALQRQIEDGLFDEFVANAIVEREMDRLGVEVTDDEVFALITGPRPDPVIAQIFPDGQGGVDRAALQQVVEDPQYAEQLRAVEEQVRRNRRQAKLAALLGATARVTDAEVEAAFVRQRRRAAAELVGLRYADVPDADVEVSDGDLRDYYRENEALYERPGLYTVEYVAFDKGATAADSARALDELRGLADGFREAPDAVAFARRNAFTSVEPRYVSAGDVRPDLATALFSDTEPGRVVGPVVAGDQAVLARITGVREAEEPSVFARHVLFPEGQEDRAREVAAQIRAGDLTFEEAAQRYSIDESNRARGGELGWFSRGRMVGAFEDAAFGAPTGQVIGPVETEFGLHLIRVEDRATEEVEIVQVTRPVEGDFQRVVEQAQDFQAFIELEGQAFAEAAAEQETSPVRVQVQEDDPAVPGLDLGRDFVRFLRGAEPGRVSDPIDAGSAFVVARLVEAREAGVAPFEEVRDQVESAVLLEKKAAVQTARLREAAAGSAPLAGVARAVGAEVRQAADLTYQNAAVPGYGSEPRAVGAAFGLQPGQRSGVVPGEQAAFVVRTTSLVGGTDGELTAAVREQVRQQLLAQKRQRVLQGWLEGLRDEAEIEDFRNEVL
jgi:peptidylprolyl isomerase/peptidyl-prolyl cis-trans isomerase D